MPVWPDETLTQEDGSGVAKAMFKVEMAKRNLTYAGLADLLARYGIKENERNLRNKISKGAFSAAFFFQCMLAMGATTLDMSNHYATYEETAEKLRKLIDAANERLSKYDGGDDQPEK